MDNDDIKVEIGTLELEEGDDQAPIEESEIASSATISPEVNRALIEAICKVMGKTVVMITSMPDLDFDESEIESLQNMWENVLPSFSPLTAAILGTSFLMSSKFALYMTLKKQQRQGPYVPPIVPLEIEEEVLSGD